jgi:carbamate kinase
VGNLIFIEWELNRMCLASKYLSQLESITREIHEHKDLLAKKMSEYDKQLVDHYHKVETTNFNACEGYYLTKDLQEILQKRRVTKDEWSKLNTLTQIIKLSKDSEFSQTKKSLGKYKEKNQQYRSNWKNTYSLEEVLH